MERTISRESKGKYDIYKDVTQRIVMKLAAGEIPWHKRWCSPLTKRCNYISGHDYGGVNLLLLDEPGEYLTFKQALDAGGNVKEGEKSHRIFVYIPWVRKEDREEYEKLKAEGKSTEHLTIPVLKYYNVFHLSQTNGLKSKLEQNGYRIAGSPTDIAQFIAEKECAKLGIRWEETNSDACLYDNDARRLIIPARTQFPTEEQWYNTLFRELARVELNLTDKSTKSNANPAYEELSAEITAGMVTCAAGLEIRETREDTLADCSKWAGELNRDFRLIVSAAGKAHKLTSGMLSGIVDEN